VILVAIVLAHKPCLVISFDPVLAATLRLRVWFFRNLLLALTMWFFCSRRAAAWFCKDFCERHPDLIPKANNI
jgi:hypothetical protein